MHPYPRPSPISLPLGTLDSSSNLIHSIQILIQNLVHGKHVDAILLEHRAQRIVAAYLALVGWVLQVSLFDVLPDFFDSLGA
jgi:hypothetical protein